MYNRCLPSSITDVCTPNPCGTHGTCSVLSGMPICDCDAGYTGDECETDLCFNNLQR